MCEYYIVQRDWGLQEVVEFGKLARGRKYSKGVNSVSCEEP